METLSLQNERLSMLREFQSHFLYQVVLNCLAHATVFLRLTTGTLVTRRVTLLADTAHLVHHYGGYMCWHSNRWERTNRPSLLHLRNLDLIDTDEDSEEPYLKRRFLD